MAKSEERVMVKGKKLLTVTSNQRPLQIAASHSHQSGKTHPPFAKFHRKKPHLFHPDLNFKQILKESDQVGRGKLFTFMKCLLSRRRNHNSDNAE